MSENFIHKWLGKVFDKHIFARVDTLLKEEYGEDWDV